MNLHKSLFYLLPLLFWSCANRVPPKGGPKDVTPPKLIGSIPKTGSINVKANEITLLFDEQIVVKNIKKELLITPRIESDYTYKTKKNTFILSLEEPLDSVTTYTFNFREAIGDITEGNPAQNLIVAFSTGPVLDTLQVTGKVMDLLTEKPEKDIIVGLYKADDTLDLFNSPPYYLAQTNKNGDYTFRNIKSDNYKIFAFKDKNNNLICQSDRESYAFLDSLIRLDSNFVARNLQLQTLNIDSIKLKRTRSSGHYFYVIANKGLFSSQLKAGNDSTLWFSYGEGRKEIKIYNTFSIKDSLLVSVTMTDSLYQSRTDSFYLSFPETQRSRDDFETNIKDILITPESKEIKFTLSASKPIQTFLTDSIYIRLDTLEQIFFDSVWSIEANESRTRFECKNYLPKQYLDSLNLTPAVSTSRASGKNRLAPSNNEQTSKKRAKSSFQLVLPISSLVSIESDTSKRLEQSLKPRYSKDYGVFMGKISTDLQNFTIQLLDKDFNIADELHNPGKHYKFVYITPGDYSIRILIDENNNGRWDPGNILLNQLPEPIFIYKNQEGISKTTIRANWEISLDLNF